MSHKKFILLFIWYFANTVSPSPIASQIELKRLKPICDKCKATTIEDLIQIEEHKSIAQTLPEVLVKRNRRQLKNVKSVKTNAAVPVLSSTPAAAKLPSLPLQSKSDLFNSIEYQKALENLLSATQQVKAIKDKYFANVETLREPSDNTAKNTETLREPKVPKFKGTGEMSIDSSERVNDSKPAAILGDVVTSDHFKDTNESTKGTGKMSINSSERVNDSKPTAILVDEVKSDHFKDTNESTKVQPVYEESLGVSKLNESETNYVGSKTPKTVASCSNSYEVATKIESEPVEKLETFSPISMKFDSDIKTLLDNSAEPENILNFLDSKSSENGDEFTFQKHLKQLNTSKVSVETNVNPMGVDDTKSQGAKAEVATDNLTSFKMDDAKADTSKSSSYDSHSLQIFKLKLNATVGNVSNSSDDIVLVKGVDHSNTSVLSVDSKTNHFSAIDIKTDAQKKFANDFNPQEVESVRKLKENGEASEMSKGLATKDFNEPKESHLDVLINNNLKSVEASEAEDKLKPKFDKPSDVLKNKNTPKKSESQSSVTDSDIMTTSHGNGVAGSRDRSYFKNHFNEGPENDFDDFDPYEYVSMEKRHRVDFDDTTPTVLRKKLNKHYKPHASKDYDFFDNDFGLEKHLDYLPHSVHEFNYIHRDDDDEDDDDDDDDEDDNDDHKYEKSKTRYDDDTDDDDDFKN